MMPISYGEQMAGLMNLRNMTVPTDPTLFWELKRKINTSEKSIKNRQNSLNSLKCKEKITNFLNITYLETACTILEIDNDTWIVAGVETCHQN